MAIAKSLSALLALLFVVSAAMVSLGDVQDKFAGGLADSTIVFPQAGGTNSSLSIELPRHGTVSGAYIEMEGRAKSYGSSSGFIDFTTGGGAYAYDGSTSTVPPKGKPSTLEGTNITNDRGLQASDNSRTTAKAPSAVPYNLFEFDMGTTELNNFDFMYEGMGLVYPDASDDPYSAVELYVYNCATGIWDLTDSYYYKGEPKDDNILHASVVSGAAGYPDSRGMLCFIAVVTPPPSGGYTGLLQTDYASLDFNGTRMLYPENLKLDLKGDGTVEWQKTGRLRGVANFTGYAFTSALQAILDASMPGTVKIPLKFTSDKGGILFVSNLSIEYDLKNLPPEANGTIPRLFLDEDRNATAFLDLWDWFKDDAGVDLLTFSIVYESDSTLVHAAMNADGHHVDLFTPTANWYGTQRIRARASDIEALTAQIDFNVTVLSVNDPPRIKGAVLLTAYQGVKFEHTFTATDVDVGVDLDDALSFSSNSTLFTVDPDTGYASFTPSNADVGIHYFNITATDHYGAFDTRNASVKVENVNDRPTIAPVTDQTATEDQPFELQLVATDADIAIGMDELAFEDNSSLFVIAQNGTLSFVPTNGDVGPHPVSVSVTDMAGLKAFANFTITVVNVNDAPRLGALADQTVEEDKELSVRAVASDDDAGDVLTLSTNDPLVKINSTGWISYKPTQKEVGLHHVTVTVMDAAGASATASFNITVQNVNDPPRLLRILGPANRTVVKQGDEINFTGSATDDDNDTLNFTWYLGDEVLGSGATFKTKDLKPGVHTITLSADDGFGPVASDPLQITVEKKKPTATPSKGFIPGFGLAAMGAVLALVCLMARRRWA